ncbi:phage tail protein [uncultured Desulfobacter sp.]|uniref:phage tail protein n=1 Tax=uncultured Desulfobacter sp. TaxID=240139 RepID=UPI0029F52BC8|nr:phage tail protein [uncultured Desulfobacter sp.]
MDVNQTKYHLVSGENDWLPLLAARTDSRLWWDNESQSVLLAPQGICLPDLSESGGLEISDRRGSCFDHYGNVYWIDKEEKSIIFRPYATPDQSKTFWSVSQLHTVCDREGKPGDFKGLATDDISSTPLLRGLTVTAQEYLVAGTHDPAGLLVFDLHAGGPPSRLRWPEKVPFEPYDLSAAPDGGLWILDRGINSGISRLWRMDRFFQVMPCSGLYDELESAATPLFHPVGESPGQRSARLFPSGIRLDLTIPLPIQEPVAVESLPDGSVLVLENGIGAFNSVVHYFRNGLAVDHVSLDEQVIGNLLSNPHIFGHDMVFKSSKAGAGTDVQGALYISASNGTQVFEFLLLAGKEQLSLTLQPPLLPMREYSGKALIEFQNTIYYDFKERWLPVTEQPRRRFLIQGELQGLVKDGKEPDCIWHRLLLDACIPEGTKVTIQIRTSNHRDLLSTEPWQEREPDLYLRKDGSEIPFHRPFEKDNFHSPGVGTWEVLLQNARGQFIEIRMVLQGTGRATPYIRALRIYYPRFSYLAHYLPSVYRDDTQSGSFLDRFLANVEGLYTSLEGRIERFEALLDPRSAPNAYLTWLLGWLGVIDDPAWDAQRRRLFLEHAELLYRWRGTRIGLRAAIRLSIDEYPDATIFDELKDSKEYRLGTLGGHNIRIVEQFLVRRLPGIGKGDVSDRTLLRFTLGKEPWAPSHGPNALHQMFRNFLTALYRDPVTTITDIDTIEKIWGTSPDQILFPPTLPDSEAGARDWMHFTRDIIGFTYAPVTTEDAPFFQEFLARRYRRIKLLNKAYGQTDEKGFNTISLPAELPHVQQALVDWIEFVSLAVPIQRNAHRFKVLVPTRLGELPQSRDRRKARVEEIMKLEKPAHTDFEVGMYWDLFQIGTARLGLDTSIGEGSRFTALVLGENYLGQAFLSASHPWCVENRTVTGRDRLTTDHTWRK